MLITSQGIPSYGTASLSSVKWLLLRVSCCLTHLPLASACVIIRFYWVLSDSSGRCGGSIGIDMDSASVLSSLSSRFGCASMFQLKLSLSASHSSSRVSPLSDFQSNWQRVTVLSQVLQLLIEHMPSELKHFPKNLFIHLAHWVFFTSAKALLNTFRGTRQLSNTMEY